jgi:hypothetical protein
VKIALTRISCGIHQLFEVNDTAPSGIIKKLTECFAGGVESANKQYPTWRHSATDKVWLDKRDMESFACLYVPSVIIFSDIWDYSFVVPRDIEQTDYAGGQHLCAYINAHPELGTCEVSANVPNTNSNSRIALYTWVLSPMWIQKFWSTRNEALHAIFDDAKEKVEVDGNVATAA